MPHTAGGRYYEAPKTNSKAVLASAARTASTTSTPFATEDNVAVEATLKVTAVAGTAPTLDLALETSFDGVLWDTVGSFPQKTAAGTHTKVFGPLGPQCRWRSTIGGSAGQSVTYSVDTKGRLL